METNELTEHSYDGIQEYDNPLPGWWKWTFVATIVFSMLYAMYYHVGTEGRSIFDQYDAAMAINARLQFADLGDLKPDADTILRYSQKPTWVRVGQTVFKTHCVSCHGRDGEGKIGPNLTDHFYKSVRKVDDIARIVTSGAGNGAMPAWANRLDPREIVLVSAYVTSIRGLDAAGGKAPEGNEIAPWPEAPPDPDDGKEAGEGSAAEESPSAE